MQNDFIIKNYCFFILSRKNYLPNKFIIYPVPLDKINVFKNLLLKQRIDFVIEFDIFKFDLTKFSLDTFYFYTKYIYLSNLYLKVLDHSIQDSLDKEYFLNITNKEFINLLNNITINNNNIFVNKTEIAFSSSNYKDYSLIFN